MARPKSLPAVRPNAGIEAAYRRALEKLVTEMHNSIHYWLVAAYRSNTPEMAQDASPAEMMRLAFRRLARRWTKNINDMAPKLAEHFATSVAERSDASLKQIFKDGGWTVAFKATAQQNDVLRASINEQVALIKSIAAEHLAAVETIVHRGVQNGRDAGYISQQLQERFGVTKRRAALISRDQCNKATSALTRSRQLSLGIEKAIWKKSIAGKTHRASHAALDGVEFSLKDGVTVDGEVCWPGTAINCKCTMRPVIPALQRLKADAP